MSPGSLHPILPTEHAAAQRFRTQRVLMAGAAYAVSWLLLILVVWRGALHMPWSLVVGLGVAALLINAGFLAMIRFGYNLRYTDASMTLPQTLIGGVWSMIIYAFGHSLRAEILMMFLCVFFFCVFRLNRRQLLAVSAYVIGLFLVVVVLDWKLVGKMPGERDALRLLLFSVSLLMIAVLGGEVYRMRETLRQQKRELERSHTVLEDLVAQDALTGLYNRRYLMLALAREEARARRSGSVFCVLMCDLDHFKSINDRYGHLAGDEALRGVAQLLSEQLRSADVWTRATETASSSVLARYGGEEFAILLVDCPLEGAQICAERLRQAVAQLKLPSPLQDLQLSASFGLAEYTQGGSFRSLLARADQALYRAKETGRNRVCIASPTLVAAEGAGAVRGHSG